MAVLCSCARAASRHARTCIKRRRTRAADRNVAGVPLGASYRGVQDVTQQLGLQLGCNSRFVAITPEAKSLKSWSERRDLNSRPPVPQTGALTGLRYAPMPR